MKLVVLIALIALAAAVPADKKPADKKPVEKKPEEKKPVDDKKPAKPEDKKNETRKGLEWPMPDPENEGDLMLHGAHLFDRVEELHKRKLEKDEDKMVLSVGREYLRRVHKYIEKETDFKVVPDLCRDSNHLNSTKRWEIRIRPEKERQPFILPSTDSKTETAKQQSDAVQANDANRTDSILPSNSTHENATEFNSNSTEIVNATEIQAKPHESFEALNKEFYKRMGDNFARLLMKRYRKEKLEKEETEYLARWLDEESVHYGFMGIYCHDGENVKELTKRIATFIDEKQ